jgi:hypothetical protein
MVAARRAGGTLRPKTGRHAAIHASTVKANSLNNLDSLLRRFRARNSNAGSRASRLAAGHFIEFYLK